MTLPHVLLLLLLLPCTYVRALLGSFQTLQFPAAADSALPHTCLLHAACRTCTQTYPQKQQPACLVWQVLRS
jgi:hypothetical protein